jgi:hypothetical protein
MSAVTGQATGLALSHFTSKPLGEIRTIEQKLDGDYRSCFEKPRGLWVSVDGEDDWASWCASNDFGLGNARYRVLLADSPRLLILDSGSALDDFTQRYGRMIERYQDTYIDWPAVAADYHGIIIAPYHWSRRMSLNWYYGWDCASGCIWNADAVARVEEHREAA